MSGSAILHIMQKAAEKAAFLLIRDFGELEKLQVSRKGFRNFVTSADRNAEARIIHELTKYHPEYSFVCEESGLTEKEDKNTAWIIDPIDGTSNFMRGIPYFAINIALRKGNDVVAGITLDPMRGECYKAEIGQGALGGRSRLRVSGREDIREALIATRGSVQFGEQLVGLGAIIRKTGSVAMDMAYLSAGKYDAVIARNVYLWDIASGIVLIKEAGGFIELSKIGSSQYNLVAASSKKLLTTCLSCLGNANVRR